MEWEMLCRLSMMMGFLFLLLGGLIVLLHSWYKSSVRDLDRMLDHIETVEEANRNEDRA